MGDPKGVMLNYQYKCINEKCLVEFGRNEHLDIGSARCPECGKVTLMRIFYPTNVIFKGTGFYSKDGKSRLTG